jgi:hypothetical protein
MMPEKCQNRPPTKSGSKFDPTPETGMTIKINNHGPTPETPEGFRQLRGRLKWQYSRRYVDQLIAAAQLFRYLSANCSRRKPEHENQLRPLVGLTGEQRPRRPGGAPRKRPPAAKPQRKW